MAALVLLSSKAKTSYTDFVFQKNDILLLGRESAGVPDEITAYCKNAVTIPMQENARSLNVAVSAAMVLGEALRQVRA
jgi:tRNA (cytidine/uridine-2'-O-)-methyltransferase